jgi:hypothetical protein
MRTNAVGSQLNQPYTTCNNYQFLYDYSYVLLLIKCRGVPIMFRTLCSLTVACSMLFSSTGLMSNDFDTQLPENTKTTEHISLTITSTKSSEKIAPAIFEPVSVVEAPIVQEPQRESYSEYTSRIYNGNRGIAAALGGTLLLCTQALYDAAVKTSGERYLPAFVKYMSPVLLAGGTIAFAAAAVMPLEQNINAEQAYFGTAPCKEQVRDHNVITKLLALGGLVVAGGIIATDYVLPYLDIK